jgi:hypothetical protein
MLSTHAYRPVLLVLVLVALSGSAGAADPVTIDVSVDLMSRYVWRGLDIAGTPSIQPSITLGWRGLEAGVWGAYTLSNQASESDEIDFSMNYTNTLPGGMTVTAIATDYYFPNAGISFFNFNDYDATKNDTIPDPGAHTIELGLSVSGPESFPAVVSGYGNVYNDAGSNMYFQLDYPVEVSQTRLDLCCGIARGSKKNPHYYGTDKLAVINVGVSAARDVTVSETFSLPLSVAFIVNPEAEVSYLVAGMSF